MTTQPDAPREPSGATAADPALPWGHEPTRGDYVCLALLTAVGLYGLAMLPLRPVMLGLAPHLSGMLGYRTGLIMVGALASQGQGAVPWPIVWVVGSLMVIKFHVLYWWAGRRWGRGLFEMFANGKSNRTRARYDQAWELTHRYGVPALLATFLPIPLPGAIVLAALGAGGMPLRTFLVWALGGSLVASGAYMGAGFVIGEPAVALMETYGKYMWYVSIAIIVGMIALSWWRSGRRQG